MTTLGSISDSPFTLKLARDAGFDREDVRHAVRHGEAVRLFRGVYVGSHIELTPALRARALVLAIGSDHMVVCDRWAAWIWGVEAFGYQELDTVPDVELAALRGHAPSEREGVRGRTRDLRPEDCVSVEGAQVTSPLRTLMDLGCLLNRSPALGVMDALTRAHGIDADAVARLLPRYRRRRGVVQLRELIPLVDGRRESPGESATALALHDFGLPAPEPQVWVQGPNGKWFRLDFAYAHAMLAIEYHGEKWHDRTKKQRRRDKLRLNWLRSQGWHVIVLRKSDMGDRRYVWLAEVDRLLRERSAPTRRYYRRTA